MMERLKILSIIQAVSSFAILVVPKIFPVCDMLNAQGQPMKCVYTYQVVFIVGVVAFLLTLEIFFIKTALWKKIIEILILVLSIVLYVLPTHWGLGICMHETSPCHQTAFWTSIFSFVLFLSAGFVLFFLSKKRRENFDE